MTFLTDIRRGAPDLEKIPEDGEEAQNETRADRYDTELVAEEPVTSPPSGMMPIITADEYNQYVRSLIKLLVGENLTFEWIKRGERFSAVFR